MAPPFLQCIIVTFGQVQAGVVHRMADVTGKAKGTAKAAAAAKGTAKAAAVLNHV